MTILDQIINSKSKSTPQSKTPTPNSKYPIHISTDSIFPNLNFTSQNPNPNFHPLFEPLSGFQISNPDLGLIDLNSNYCNKLESLFKGDGKKPKLFIDLIIEYLEKIGEIKFGGLIDLGFEKDGDFNGYCCDLLKKFGSFVGLDVMSFIIGGCFNFSTYDLLETLIVNGFVDYSLRSSLLVRLMQNRYDLVCLCVRRFGEVGASDLFEVLRLFLSPGLSEESNVKLDRVRKEWESDALGVIDIVGGNKLSGKKMGLANDASLLLMLAYDEFSSFELCLHFVLSSQRVDDVVFASAVSKLDLDQLLCLIRYLGKWLRKYERFPQVGPCPEAVSSLGLKMCQWVPRVEDVVKCLGLVVDEHFSSLSMRSEFHEDLKAVEEIVSSLVCEGKSSTSIANLIEISKPNAGDA